MSSSKALIVGIQLECAAKLSKNIGRNATLSPKYNILKFTESYRKAEHRHTILLPVLMFLVVAFAFFLILKSRPRSSSEKIGYQVPASVGQNKEVGLSSPPKIDLDMGLDFDSEFNKFPIVEPGSEIALLPPPTRDTSIPSIPVVKARPVSKDGLPLVKVDGIENSFTEWMTQNELNEHIYTLNEGFDIPFWDRGYWIVAVEGRWVGQQEFRIVYEKNPTVVWRYEISKTKEKFLDKINAHRKDGYTLVQSQSFETFDQTLRYQGVWRKFN